MTNRIPAGSYQPAIAAILSSLFCGLGQIYLHRVVKGLILALSFSCAILIIWIAVSDKEFKVINWDGKQLMFSPSRRSISVRGRSLQMTDMMKITGTIQLAFTWIFSVIDAWREGRKQIGRTL